MKYTCLRVVKWSITTLCTLFAMAFFFGIIMFIFTGVNMYSSADGDRWIALIAGLAASSIATGIFWACSNESRGKF